MTKLFVDTNIYLNFYRSANDRLSLFEELKKLEKTLIVSEQGYKEFQRNRTAQLNKLSAEFEKISSMSIYTTAIVKDMSEHQEAIRLQTQIREVGKKLKGKIEAMLEPKPGDDPVLDAYDDLIKICTFIETKESLIVKAEMRKILGNPPTSPDRHSICDELLWEELIEFCDEDLIIVSNDKTFTENRKILKDEFSKAHPGKNLQIVKSVSDALRILGEVSDRLEATEAEMEFSVDQQSWHMADVIMEIAIRKSSSIIVKNDREYVSLKIGNVTLARKAPEKLHLLDALKELTKMKLIQDAGNGIYELTENGRNYVPFDK